MGIVINHLNLISIVGSRKQDHWVHLESLFLFLTYLVNLKSLSFNHRRFYLKEYCRHRRICNLDIQNIEIASIPVTVLLIFRRFCIIHQVCRIFLDLSFQKFSLIIKIQLAMTFGRKNQIHLARQMQYHLRAYWGLNLWEALVFKLVKHQNSLWKQVFHIQQLIHSFHWHQTETSVSHSKIVVTYSERGLNSWDKIPMSWIIKVSST